MYICFFSIAKSIKAPLVNVNFGNLIVIVESGRILNEFDGPVII